jgi:hypothetical protein
VKTSRHRRSLKHVALHIAEVIGREDCMLIGAMAVAAHGYPRATKDVDLITRLPLMRARLRLVTAGVKAVLRSGHTLDGDFSCIRGTWGGVPYDVLPQLVPIDWDNAPEVVLAPKRALRVVDLDDLLALKLRAQGPQDLLDVAMLILTHPAERERAFALAEAYRVRDRLETFLASARVVRSHAARATPTPR